MEEKDYMEVFGLDEGAKEQEVATPAEEQKDTTDGGKEQEVAEPAVEEDAAQSKEENAQFAAARRKAEQERDAAIAQAKAEAQKTIDEAFASSGLVDPYTKKPITSKAEYDAYQKKLAEEKQQRILSKTGMSQEQFDEYVGNLPEVKRAKEAADAAERERAQMRINDQIREIGQYDPNIKSIEDLVRMDKYDEFHERVKRGMSLTDAYKLTHFDALTKGATAAARQAAINSVNGKSHMQATSSRGAGGVSVPSDVMAMYKKINPKATDAEIQAHYARQKR